MLSSSHIVSNSGRRDAHALDESLDARGFDRRGLKPGRRIAGQKQGALPKALWVVAALCVAATNVLFGASDVTVKSGTTKGGTFHGTDPRVFTPSKAAAAVGRGVIKSTLNAGRGVTIKTASAAAGNGDLTVAIKVAKTKGRSATLTLEAVRDIVVKSPISPKKTMPLALSAGGGISSSAAISSGGGNVTINTIEPFALGSSLSAGTGQVLLQSGSVESTSAQTVTASSVEVSAGAAWRLNGSVAGNMSVAGIVSPGAQGTTALQVDGALVLQSTATTAVNLGGSSQGTNYGRIAVTGAVTLAGALQIDFTDGFEDLIEAFNSFTILSGASISGTFTGLPNNSRLLLPDDLGSVKITYSATSVTVSDWQPIIVDLAWDPGTTDAGTNVFTNTRPRGRRHYFRVHTQPTDIEAWRSRLTPPPLAEADLYMSLGGLPTAVSSQYRSKNVGADGFVLNRDQFAAGQEWLFLIDADPGTPWSFFSGRAFVQDLGTLAWTDTNASGSYDIGEPVLPSGSGPMVIEGEGMRFFKTTIPTGTPAWSLWLNGSNKDIAVRTAVVPFHSAPVHYDRKQSGQLLLVPPYLGSGVATYFVSVVGNPGEIVNLDSRIQEVSDIAFDSIVSNVPVPGAPYRVYRTQVPVQQIAWDISTVALAGDPNVAVRRDSVPAEYDNDAYSEVTGNVSDSITLVPSFLTDGTWFITVYGNSAYTFTLKNGPPIVTPLQFTSTTINDQTLRAGWRFYALTDIPPQLGALGWELQLFNHVPGTEIAVRRNAVPSRRRYRIDGLAAIIKDAAVEFSSTAGFLQRQGHQADIWYVGIYMPTEALGTFTLSCYPIEAATVPFDAGTGTGTNLEPGRWEFFRVDVPAGVVGWDVRVRNVIGANPTIVVRRDLLPIVAPPNWSPSMTPSWPSGNQWEGATDWTGYTLNPGGALVPPGLVAGMGRPLEPGTYYVGVFNNSTTSPINYTVESRGIGPGQTCPLPNLAYAGGTVTITDLAPREAQYFKVNIPANTPSWEVTLATTVGELELLVRRDTVPDFTATSSGNVYLDDVEVEMNKLGPDRYVLLPPLGAQFVPPGDYYLAVVSEGVTPLGSTIGAGTSSGFLTSIGPLAVTDLGAATAAGTSAIVTLEAGQIKAYQFTVPVDTYSLEVRLENRIGFPAMAVGAGPLLPIPAGTYGNDGGNGGFPVSAGAFDSIIVTAANPSPGVWSVLVNAGTASSASANLVVKAIGIEPLAFDGGTVSVTGHEAATVRYFVVNVPAGVVGWDVRLRDVIGPIPTMVVRPNLLPAVPGTNWTPSISTVWPSANQWQAGTDWTGYSLDPGSIPVAPRLVAGMGHPLEPGTYYIALFNNDSINASSYVIDSRGIGAGQTYPTPDLDYAGGTATITGLAPREAKYFKVSIPSGTPSWEVTLEPTAGELELLVRRDTVADFEAALPGSVHNPGTGVELEMKKLGPERYVLLPVLGQDFLPVADYYLAVVGEGVNPSGSLIGAGTCDAVLTSIGPLAATYLGNATPAGMTQSVGLVGGQIKAYQFTVTAGTDSLEVRLEGTAGYPAMSLGQGPRFPTPPGASPLGTYPYSEYGHDGGNGLLQSNSIFTVANPTPGIWSVLVRAGHDPQNNFPDAAANLVVTALSKVPLAFDGGNYAVIGQQPSTWRYFVVTVPVGAMGWDVRLRDASNSPPAMMVRRDLLPAVFAGFPPDNIPMGWVPRADAIWASGNQWLAGTDWTGYSSNGTGVSVPPRLVSGMGRPLQPGTYYVGVFNSTSAVVNYTIDSRGIGAGLTYGISDLNYAGGTATITDLASREAQYFKLNIPPNTPSWEVTLSSIAGEVELLVRRDTVPDFTASPAGSVYIQGDGAEVEMQKKGPERYVLLPTTNQDFIPTGDYYLAVVSEGVNPSGSTIGPGVSSGELTSVGAVGITNLGAATVAGLTEPVSLASAQLKAYSFTVPAGTHSLEVRLDNAIGYPAMSMVQGTRLPTPPGVPPLGNQPYSEYGHDGGNGGTQAVSIQTVANPASGQWSMLVRARHDPQSTFPDASANLVIRRKQNIPLNFAASQNAGGGSNTDTRQAIDGEYNIYEVAVPPIVDGQPVVGWIVQTEVLQGAASFVVYKNFADPTSGITIPTGFAVVVPPFLTAGDKWYIRVSATGLTQYTITSRPVTLERPVWQMPGSHNLTFGDSGNDSAGNPLPGDRGVDLAQGFWHFYAVDVTAANAGLLRTELQAISGNPDLYIREDGVPTTSHFSNGSNGNSLVHRALTGLTSSAGNWVPLDGRTQVGLTPGRWYLGVRAVGNSNVRYRLILSTGNVKDLSLDPATGTPQRPNSITEDSLVDNDWRYYRFTVPMDAPKNWTLTFSQQVGDVVMWLRDSVPPGQRAANSGSSSDISSWSSDVKNQGPYPVGHDLVGAYTFTTPPLRPGNTYYAGFRSKDSATFSLSSDTSGGSIGALPSLDFYTGTVTTTVPPNSALLYQIPAPPEATRMKWTATHTTSITIRMEQGTIPSGSGNQHFISSGANESLNQALSGTSWPWQPNQTYFVRFVNNSATGQSITFTLNGKNALTEDEDNDGLLDAWERQYFNSLTQSAAGDPDNDGVTNATEFVDGTNPNDSNSAKYTLTVLARNGAAIADPVQTKYDRGSIVTITNTPEPGYNFVSWTGGPFRGDDFAIRATATITLPTDGTWTFGINAADGALLRVNGVTVISDDTQHDARDTLAEITLPAGNYPLELIGFERVGGEGLELFAALGSFTTFNNNFTLVGDIANGGLAIQSLSGGVAVPEFTVRQVESISISINSLLAANNLLAGSYGARQDVTGLIDVLNFLTYEVSEGHFGGNAHFPLTSAIEDQPLLLAIKGDYTITALNSLPLATALDGSLTWLTGSNLPWLGENTATAFDGVNAAGSGPIGDNQSSYLRTSVTGPGTLTFYWKVSSEIGDNLLFLIDGVQQASITGNFAWTQRTFNIAAGVHTLTWSYAKNATGAAGNDRGWVDQVVFTP